MLGRGGETVSKRKARGYQSYGSTKSVWKFGAMLFLAALGGIGCAILLAVLERGLPALGALALSWAVLVLGVVGIAVCTRTGHFCWAFFLVMFCVFAAWGLAATARMDILARATLLQGGSRPLLVAVSVLLTVAIGFGMWVIFGRQGLEVRDWLCIIVVSLFTVFPSLNNSMAAINVAAETKTAYVSAIAEVTQTRVEEERVLLGSRGNSLYMDVHYVTVAQNAIVPADTELKVSEELYPRLQPGGQVSIILHPGALGMPWVEVAPVE